MIIKKIHLAFFLTICSLYISCNETQNPTDNNAQAVKIVDEAVQAKKEEIVKDSIDPKYKIDFDRNYLMGKFDPIRHKDFMAIPMKYASRKGMRMRKDAFEAFEKMYQAAKEAGFELKIVSATRPFDHQKTIWEGKWTGARKVGGKDLSKSISSKKDRALKILEYSSMPGTSRHHWGTDIDLNALENSYFEKGKGAKLYEWLTINADQFGYRLVYTEKGKDRPDGYNEEKWHWSFYPVSVQLTRACDLLLQNEMIEGFKGAEQAVEIDVLNKYILGINKECL